MQYKKEARTPILSPKIAAIITNISRSRTLSSSLIKRATIVLRSSQGAQNKIIAVEIGMHHTNVGKWRTRFIKGLPLLNEIEEKYLKEDPRATKKLQKEIEKLLTDKQRPGKPREYTQEQITMICHLACTDPKDYGYEVSQWSLGLLVQESEKQGIVERTSKVMVSRFLKSGQFKTT